MYTSHVELTSPFKQSQTGMRSESCRADCHGTVGSIPVAEDAAYLGIMCVYIIVLYMDVYRTMGQLSTLSIVTTATTCKMHRLF